MILQTHFSQCQTNFYHSISRETKRLNEQVSNRSQIVTSNFPDRGGRRYLPYAFTEQGVAMLSGILNSSVAIQVSIRIMQTFVEMRKTISAHAGLLQRLDRIETKQLESDQKFEQIFTALEAGITPKAGIFFDGQTFDAWSFISDLVRSAQSEIILIDNYVDDTVF